VYPTVVRSSIDSSDPRPRALGDNHATDAVPKDRLSDGCMGEWSRFEEQDIQGLIPRTSLD
jgi:hypothetical protein